MKKLIDILKRIDATEWFAVFVVCYMVVVLGYTLSIGESYATYIGKFDTLNREYETLKLKNDELVLNLNNKTEAYKELMSENLSLSKQVEEKPINDILQIAGDVYGIDSRLLEAIERLESGNYTSENYKTLNNTWGATHGNGYLEFESHEQSTMELARTLKWYYIDEGLDTIEKIATKYCPDDSEWASKVRAIYNELE